jgi:hypothetical protein
MKRLMVSVLLLAAAGALVFAEGAPKGSEFGIQTSLGVTNSPVGGGVSSIGAKFFLTDAVALRAEFGLLSSSGGGTTTTGFEFGVGGEYHFAGKGGVSPYIGAQFGYGGGSVPGGAAAPSIFAILAAFGGEYFFSSNFSLAGEVRFGFSSENAAGVTTSNIGTAGVGLIGTWYIN